MPHHPSSSVAIVDDHFTNPASRSPSSTKREENQ
jgi:hypothetical protein